MVDFRYPTAEKEMSRFYFRGDDHIADPLSNDILPCWWLSHQRLSGYFLKYVSDVLVGSDSQMASTTRNLIVVRLRLSRSWLL